MASRKLVIEVVGDASQLNRTFKQAATSTNKFGRSLDGLNAGRSTQGLAGLSALAKGGTIALGLGIATQQMVKLTAAASDLNEQITKSQQVFGASSTEIERWSRTTAQSIGVSETAALTAAGTFGNLFATVRVAPQQAAAMSRALVQLAADLASFNNADPSETLAALQSGLVGEAEPLRRFGVLLSEARVQQQALADTGKTNTKSLTDQEKTLARYELILRDSVKAQGDFSRTSGGLANQQRILRARLADTEAEIGKRLLPAQIKLTHALLEGINAGQGFASAVGDVNAKLDDVHLGFLNRGAIQIFDDGPAQKLIKSLEAMQAAVRATDDEAKKLRDTFASLPGAIDLNPSNVSSLTGRRDTGTKTPGTPSFGQPGFKVGKAPAVPLGPSVEQRNRFFDDAIGRREDRVQDITSLQGQVKELGEIAGLIQKRIDSTKDVTRRLNLEDELVQVRRRRKSVLEQIADDQRQRAQDARDAKRAADDAAREAAKVAAALKAQRQQSRQFRAIGLSAEGGDVVPGVANLRKQLASLTKRTDIGDASPKLRSQLIGVRKVLSGEFGKATEESRSKIQDLFATIRQELNKGVESTTGGPLTKTTALSSERILAGLGLSRADERVLRARLSHFNSAGKALSGSGAGSRARASTIVVQQPDIIMDGQKLTSSVSKRQRRTRSVNPSQRNGPNQGLIIT